MPVALAEGEQMVPLILIAACCGIMLAGFVYLNVQARKQRSATWDGLVARLEALPQRGLEAVALDNLQPKSNQLQFEPSELWQLVGGMEGLRRMRANANVMIALAAHVHQWNYEEAIIVAERMRRDAVQLKKAVFRIRMAMLLHRQISVPFNIHEAATSYYLMTQRLLVLYQRSHAGLYPRLAAAF